MSFFVGISDKELFVNNSPYSGSNRIKSRYLETGVEERCSKCGLGPSWNNEHLVLQLEHKNGIATDHRLENLSLLCPNCHSQTATYAGRNARKPYRDLFSQCVSCGIDKSRTYSSRCQRCGVRESKQRHPQPFKIDWPSPEEVSSMVKSLGIRVTSERLGVTGTAVKKYLKKHNLWVPLRGSASPKR